MILVDSSVWIDYFRGTTTSQTDRLEALLAAEPRCGRGCDPGRGSAGLQARAEVRRRAPHADLADHHRDRGADIAIEAARNFTTLGIHGVTVRKTIDTLIAARCIVDRHSLLYSDRDFDPFVMHLELVSTMDNM